MYDVNMLVSSAINIEKSLKFVGNIEVYNEEVKHFLISINSRVINLKKYCDENDISNYIKEVTELKEISNRVGFDILFNLAYLHQLQANDYQFITENINTLLREMVRISSVLQKYIGVGNKKSILVVDDSSIIRNFVKKIFDNDYNVLVASDGGEAIEILEKNKKDIVGMLLDLNMPNVNGFEVLEYLKNNNLFSTIPVSLITGDDSKDGISKAFTYPIIDMLNKPFTEKEVRRIVEKTVSISK